MSAACTQGWWCSALTSENTKIFEIAGYVTDSGSRARQESIPQRLWWAFQKVWVRPKTWCWECRLCCAPETSASLQSKCKVSDAISVQSAQSCLRLG